jgi:hypothetical protein
MIRFQTISTSDVQHYQFMENLLIAAFPPEEYRELKELREYTDRTGNFYNNIIFDNETPVGFITYWDFNDFYYVEHFAIPLFEMAVTAKRHWIIYVKNWIAPSCWK